MLTLMVSHADSRALVTVPEDDFSELYENMPHSDYDLLRRAVNADGVPYQIVELPLTKKNVTGLEIKGSYINYYVANTVVLLPVYGDENDAHAQKIVADLYPGRTVVPCREALSARRHDSLHYPAATCV